jgi:hypothetical protein
VEQRRGVLTPYDEELARLRAGNPAWNIWFVPHTQLSGGFRIVWCAQPKPLLNCGSPGELTAEMRAADHWRYGARPEQAAQ